MRTIRYIALKYGILARSIRYWMERGDIKGSKDERGRWVFSDEEIEKMQELKKIDRRKGNGRKK